MIRYQHIISYKLSLLSPHNENISFTFILICESSTLIRFQAPNHFFSFPMKLHLFFFLLDARIMTVEDLEGEGGGCVLMIWAKPQTWHSFIHLFSCTSDLREREPNLRCRVHI